MDSDLSVCLKGGGTNILYQLTMALCLGGGTSAVFTALPGPPFPTRSEIKKPAGPEQASINVLASWGTQPSCGLRLFAPAPAPKPILPPARNPYALTAHCPSPESLMLEDYYTTRIPVGCCLSALLRVWGFQTVPLGCLSVPEDLGSCPGI